MTEGELSDDLWALLFSVRRSQRYHERRAAFFENLHRLTNLTTIVIAGVVLMESIGAHSPWYVKLLALLAAMMGVADLVVGFSRRAAAHGACRNQFIDLEASILGGASYDGAVAQRLKIQRMEPAIYRALDVMCHNETCVSMGCADQQRVLPLLQRLTAHVFHWSNAGSTARPLRSDSRAA